MCAFVYCVCVRVRAFSAYVLAVCYLECSWRFVTSGCFYHPLSERECFELFRMNEMQRHLNTLITIIIWPVVFFQLSHALNNGSRLLYTRAKLDQGYYQSESKVSTDVHLSFCNYMNERFEILRVHVN